MCLNPKQDGRKPLAACPIGKQSNRGDGVPQFQVNGRTYQVDKDGFLQDADLWNEEVAKDFATTEKIADLSKDHWNIINYIRNYYESYGIAPMIRKVCKETGFNLDQIYNLFPSGPAKGACKVAGLPKPAGCV